MLRFSHRGIHDRKTSENTLEAFQKAVDRGVDGIEFDLRLSRDGVPVALHDESLDRIAGDARRVSDLSADELQKLVLRGSGSIPTLNQITASIPAPVILDIEIKDRAVIPVLIAKLKTSARLRERVMISSFVLEDLVQIHRALPQIKTLSLNRTWPLPFRGGGFWQRLKDAGVWGVGYPARNMTVRRMSLLRQKGWKVVAWDLQSNLREARRLAKLRPDIAVVFRIEACV